ncbi:MAG: V-type ATPase subunit [Spirochaetes bacterium]|nr:V-type ATPase subunit [Spirochaetota bacterium]
MFKYDYIQAKLHGMHSKSIIRENFNKLKKINSIEKLAKELFPEDSFLYTGSEIYNEIEKKYKYKIFGQLNFIAKYFEFKNKLINNMLLKYELDNIKLILNAYFLKQKNVSEMFELSIINILDYKKIKNLDLSNFENIRAILSDTDFSFLIPLILETEYPFIIENTLDKYYFSLLVDSLKSFNKYIYNNMKEILIYEMNWQNIIWAFRTKIYYKKTFKNVADTFINHNWLIPVEKLEPIFDLTFIPDEQEKLLNHLPSSYYNFILNFFNKEGEFNVIAFEEKISESVINHYSKFFFIENFNILPIVSFIYLKYIEYNNIIKITESLRYNLKME